MVPLTGYVYLYNEAQCHIQVFQAPRTKYKVKVDIFRSGCAFLFCIEADTGPSPKTSNNEDRQLYTATDESKSGLQKGSHKVLGLPSQLSPSTKGDRKKAKGSQPRAIQRHSTQSLLSSDYSREHTGAQSRPRPAAHLIH